MAKLIYQDPSSGQEVSVEVGPDFPEVTIGRNPGNIVRVNNPSISRKHAKILFDNGQCTIYDLNSSNGTYINGSRVGNQALVDGDRIRVGEFPLDFVETAAAAEQAAVQYDSTSEFDSSTAAQAAEMVHGGYAAQSDVAQIDADFGASADFSELGGEPTGYMDDDPEPPSTPFGPPDVDQFEAEPLVLDDDDVEEILDDEVLEVEPEPAGPAATYEESGVHGFAEASGDADPDTVNAPPEQIGEGLRHMGAFDGGQVVADEPQPQHTFSPGAEPSDATAVEEPEHIAAAFSGAGGADAAELEALRQANAELEARVEDLQDERDALSAALDEQADDLQGASKMQIDRLRKERDRLTDERRNLMRQLSELRGELDQRPEIDEHEALEADLAQTREEVEDLLAQLEEARQNVTIRDETIDTLQDQIEGLEEELDGVKAEFEATERERIEAFEESSQLGEQLSEVKEDLEGFEARYHEASQTIGQLEETVAALEAERDGLNETIREREETIVELETAAGDLEQAIAERDTRLEALSGDAGELEQRLEALTHENQELSKRLTPEAAAELEETLEARQAELAEVTAERDGLVAERDRLAGELDDARKTIEAFDERFEEVASERDELRRERDALKQEKAAFARETDYLQDERRKYDKQISELSDEVKDLKRDAKRKRKIFKELERDLRALVVENNETKQKLADAEAQLAEAPSPDDLSEREELLAELEAETNRLRETVAELEEETSELTKELGQVAAERDELDEKLDAVETELTAVKEAAGGEDVGEAIGALEEAKAELEQARDDLSDRLADAEEARDELSEKLEALEAERDELSETVDELNEAISERDATIAELEEQAQAEALEKLEEAEGERDALAEKLAEAQEKLDEIETKNGEVAEHEAKLMEEIEKLKADLKDRESTLEALILERDKLEDQLEQQG